MLAVRTWILILGLLFPIATRATRADEVHVLFFTQQGCPPCRQMEPEIARLAQDGLAVTTIHLETHGEYAQQCGVTQTPTIIIAEGNRVLDRRAGYLSYAQLSQLAAPYRPLETPVNTAVNGNPPAMREAPSAGDQRQNDPEEVAMRASVRIRVADAQGHGTATGTIIHRNEGEALVLTCGHVFRESQGRGKIEVELGFGGERLTTVGGKLMQFDADAHDIALITIPCPLEIQPVPVAPEALKAEIGDAAFALGCDEGADPSLRRTTLKSVSRYSGVEKYDIVGRPVYGRSGGGLFTAGGQLIGVCNAQAVNEDEGIYAGLESIYWLFAKIHLTHLFRAHPHQPENRLAGVNAGSSSSEDAKPPKSPSSTEFEVQPAVFRGSQPPVRNAGSANQPETAQSEMIVIIRSGRSGRGESETLVIPNPDADLLGRLRKAASNPEDGVGEPPAAMADLRPVTRSGNVIRGQSPR